MFITRESDYAQVIRYCAWKNKEKSRQIFQNIENDRSIGVEFVV